MAEPTAWPTRFAVPVAKSPFGHVTQALARRSIFARDRETLRPWVLSMCRFWVNLDSRGRARFLVRTQPTSQNQTYDQSRAPAYGDSLSPRKIYRLSA